MAAQPLLTNIQGFVALFPMALIGLSAIRPPFFVHIRMYAIQILPLGEKSFLERLYLSRRTDARRTRIQLLRCFRRGVSQFTRIFMTQTAVANSLSAGTGTEFRIRALVLGPASITGHLLGRKSWISQPKPHPQFLNVFLFLGISTLCSHIPGTKTAIITANSNHNVIGLTADSRGAVRSASHEPEWLSRTSSRKSSMIWLTFCREHTKSSLSTSRVTVPS